MVENSQKGRELVHFGFWEWNVVYFEEKMEWCHSGRRPRYPLHRKQAFPALRKLKVGIFVKHVEICLLQHCLPSHDALLCQFWVNSDKLFQGCGHIICSFGLKAMNVGPS